MIKKYAGLHCNNVETKIKNLVITIRFLKSTDDDMLKTLETMSGVTHKVRADSKTVTSDMSNITELNRNEGKMSYNIATKEEPVISFNDMAFIPDRNSMVFRAGDSPIWNRQEMVLPMSWRLFSNTIVNPGHNYSLQTIPTLSTAMDFDVRKNQPDFNHWFNKRLTQMIYVDEATEKYKSLHNYSDRDIELLDPDIYADDIMRIVNSLMNSELMGDDYDEYDYDDSGEPMVDPYSQSMEMMEHAEDNDEVIKAKNEAESQQAHYEEKIYGRGKVSRSAFVTVSGQVRHEFDEFFKRIFRDDWQKFADDTEHFKIVGGRDAGFAAHGNLLSADGTKTYFEFNKSQARLDSDDYEMLSKQSIDADANVYADSQDDIQDMYDKTINFVVTDDFYRYLISLSANEFSKLAGGLINDALYNEVVNGADYK